MSCELSILKTPMEAQLMTSDSAPPIERKTILMIATRDLRGRMTGRKAVLRTTSDSLVGLGHRVLVAHFGDAQHNIRDEEANLNSRIQYFSLMGPRPWELVRQFVLEFLPGRKSLNECLYASKRAEKALRRIVHAENVEIVITDMIRTVGYGELMNLPWIADLDDLLSLRYRRIAKERRGLDGLLGYHKAPVLRALSWFIRPAARIILDKEATILERREITAARQANVTLTVSSAEATALSKASLRPVSATPFCVQGPDHIAPLKSRVRQLVFLGGMSYQPNRNAVQMFDKQILGQLRSSGIDDINLDVIGEGEESIRREFSPNVRFVGYVEDLDHELQKYKAMLVPELLQGGIKTKIVHAALNGVVVLAHDSAIEGMGLERDINVLTWHSPQELAALLRRIQGTDSTLDRIAENALRWATVTFGVKQAEAKWKAHLESLDESCPKTPKGIRMRATELSRAS